MTAAQRGLRIGADLRPVALGLVVGAAAETAFFFWLFTELAPGLNSL